MIVGYYKVICSVECTYRKLSTIVRVSVHKHYEVNTKNTIKRSRKDKTEAEIAK